MREVVVVVLVLVVLVLLLVAAGIVHCSSSSSTNATIASEVTPLTYWAEHGPADGSEEGTQNKDKGVVVKITPPSSLLDHALLLL